MPTRSKSWTCLPRQRDGSRSCLLLRTCLNRHRPKDEQAQSSHGWALVTPLQPQPGTLFEEPSSVDREHWAAAGLDAPERLAYGPPAHPGRRSAASSERPPSSVFLYDSPQGSSGQSSPGEQYLRYGTKLASRKQQHAAANPLLTDSGHLESSLIPPGQLYSRSSSHRRRSSRTTLHNLHSSGAVSIAQRGDLLRTSPSVALQSSGGQRYTQFLKRLPRPLLQPPVP